MHRHPLSLVSAVAVTILAVAGAMPGAAATIAISGTFDDPTAPEADGDVITLSNDPTSQSYITQVVFDLSTSASTVVFDPTDSAFAPTGGSELVTGLFNVVFTGSQTLTLEFADFAPGETFSFRVDLDDNNTRVDRNRIQGATISATFAANGGTVLPATMVAPATGSGRNLSWVANTVTPVPESTSGVLLGLGLAALAWRERSPRRAPHR